MIFLLNEWNGPSGLDAARAASSLGLFVGAPANRETLLNGAVAELPLRHRRVLPGWRAQRSPGGCVVLLSGWIDNVDDLSQELGIEGSAERLYGAAVERWGDNADSHVIGEYATVVVQPDGAVRLARSPWAGFPLFYRNDADALIACSIPRPLFAAGVPKELRASAIERLVSFEMPEDDRSMFEGIDMVSSGTVITIRRGSVSINRWYDPDAIAPVRFARDEDYVEAANALLAKAVKAALAYAKKPAIGLSGGLDSPVVCDEVLRQLPEGQRLTAITFVPLPDWDGQGNPYYFSSDRPNVEAFAKMHPNLDTVFVANEGIDFTDRAEQMFMAADAGYPAQVMGSVHNGVLDAARERGCDVLIAADMGNATFSTEAPWAYGEFFRKGRFVELWKLAASRWMDPRPMWRRVLALGLMPNLPRRLRDAIRDRVHGRDADLRLVNQYLSESGALATKLRERNLRGGGIASSQNMLSQRSAAREMYDTMWIGSEIAHGVSQVFGIVVRDVTSYRPFIEFCMGLPTDQFVRGGQTRWLARRMAQGRMPEAQRLERRQGEHNVDWHARLTPRVPELREEVRKIAEHPYLGGVIDTGRMLYDLDNWPETAIDDVVLIDRLRFMLPAVVYVRQFVDFTSGRNPQ
jgi:asparagine synthase (glutamine-hydrolysing)